MPMDDLISDLTGMQTDYEVADMGIIDANAFIQNLSNFSTFSQSNFSQSNFSPSP